MIKNMSKDQLIKSIIFIGFFLVTIYSGLLPLKKAEAANNGFEIKDEMLIDYHGKDSDVIIPNTVKVIAYKAFDNCKKMKSITIPDTVITIADCAFYNCTNLEKISVPSSVTNIGASAFYNTKWLKEEKKKSSLVIINNILIDGTACKGEVEIPETITSIAAYAFCDVSYEDDGIDFLVKYLGSKLTQVIIPDTVVSIGEGAFRECDELTRVTLSNNVQTIKAYTFYHCNSLINISIPDSISYIGYKAFNACTGLKDIKIPKSIKNVGAYTFSNTKWIKNRQKENH